MMPKRRVQRQPLLRTDSIADFVTLKNSTRINSMETEEKKPIPLWQLRVQKETVKFIQHVEAKFLELLKHANSFPAGQEADQVAAFEIMLDGLVDIPVLIGANYFKDPRTFQRAMEAKIPGKFDRIEKMRQQMAEDGK